MNEELKQKMLTEGKHYFSETGPVYLGMQIWEDAWESCHDEMEKQVEELVEALEFYANDENWLFYKNPETGSEIRRSICLEDTESFGFQSSPHDKNILQVFSGKHAKQALAKFRGEK
ncbi:MAG: hypothetical protein ACRCST_00740 [Turicibacter sp.]